MTHLEVENLVSDYLEGGLEAARASQVAEHLAACSGCREMIADVRRVVELCRSADDLESPSWLVSKILLATVGERKPTLKERIAAIDGGSVCDHLAQAHRALPAPGDAPSQVGTHAVEAS